MDSTLPAADFAADGETKDDGADPDTEEPEQFEPKPIAGVEHTFGDPVFEERSGGDGAETTNRQPPPP